MKVTELRLNNWIIQNGEPKQFKGDFNNCIYGKIQPIPLTEGWLLSFGYRLKCNSSYAHNKYQYLGKKIVISCKATNNYHFSHGKVILQYVHQLQNLYFALTDEELILIER